MLSGARDLLRPNWASGPGEATDVRQNLGGVDERILNRGVPFRSITFGAVPQFTDLRQLAV